MKAKKVLILGGSSFIGRHLYSRLGEKKAVATYFNTPIPQGIYFDSLSMSLSDTGQDLNSISHAVILLGDTNPETCFSYYERSQLLNVDSIKRIIDELVRWDIKIIFTSSEFVFDGTQGQYRETDPVSPILIYGSQKSEVEKYIQEKSSDYVIARLAKVCGDELGDGTLFTNWMDAMDRVDRLKCARDQVFSPIYVGDVVESIMSLMEGDCRGIFHVSGAKSYARIELLNMLKRHMSRDFSVKVSVESCSIRDFDLREKRPLDTSMNSAKLVEETGVQLTDMDTLCQRIVLKKRRLHDS